MGTGLQRVAKLCGGLTVQAGGRRVRYNQDGKIVKEEYVFKQNDIVYHRWRGRGVFRSYWHDPKECCVLFDRRDSGVSVNEGERVNISLLSDKPYPGQA